MIVDTTLKPEIMGQEMLLSVILGALVLTILWYRLLVPILLMRFKEVKSLA